MCSARRPSSPTATVPPVRLATVAHLAPPLAALHLPLLAVVLPEPVHHPVLVESHRPPVVAAQPVAASPVLPDHPVVLDATANLADPEPLVFPELPDVRQPSARPPSHLADHAHRARRDHPAHQEAQERAELKDQLADQAVKEPPVSRDLRDHQDSPESWARPDHQENLATPPRLRPWCQERQASPESPAHQDPLDLQAHPAHLESPAALDRRDPMVLKAHPERTASLEVKARKVRWAAPVRRASAPSTAPPTAVFSSRTALEDSEFNLKLLAA